MNEPITPYRSAERKKRQVEKMFDNIAHKYDFLNHFMSAGIDTLWRKRLVGLLLKERPQKVLDVATGTADLAIMTVERSDAQVTGIDLSAGMLAVGQKKIEAQKLGGRVRLIRGDCEDLPFRDASFDALTAAFGLRNFEDLRAGLREMSRVTKAGGQNLILEFSKPKRFPIKQLYHLYFHYITPAIGRYFSKDKHAYGYLFESVEAFPQGEALKAIILSCGFSTCSVSLLSGGIVTCYVAVK